MSRLHGFLKSLLFIITPSPRLADIDILLSQRDDFIHFTADVLARKQLVARWEAVSNGNSVAIP